MPKELLHRSPILGWEADDLVLVKRVDGYSACEVVRDDLSVISAEGLSKRPFWLIDFTYQLFSVVHFFRQRPVLAEISCVRCTIGGSGRVVHDGIDLVVDIGGGIVGVCGRLSRSARLSAWAMRMSASELTGRHDDGRLRVTIDGDESNMLGEMSDG